MNLKTEVKTCQNFMIYKCTECFPCHGSNFRPKVLNRIQIREIHPPMIWLLTFCTKFLDIHAKKTYFYSFNFLEQQNHLKQETCYTCITIFQQEEATINVNHCIFNESNALAVQCLTEYLRFIPKFLGIIFLLKYFKKSLLDFQFLVHG